MNTTAVSIIAAGTLVAGAVLYASGVFDRLMPKPPFEQALRDGFRDPNSVQIRNVVQDSSIKWCGEVNGKNILGLYTGWDRFVALRLGNNWDFGLESSYLARYGSDGQEVFERMFCNP